MRSILIATTFAILTSGCAIGVKHDYSYTDANWNVQTDKPVAVAVHDDRPYIADGDKTPDFVGLSRGGFGNPFDVVTASGKPVAEDMTTAIVNGLKASNIAVRRVDIPARRSRSQARAAVLAAGAARALLITLQEWKTDTYVNSRLLYDVRAQVFDGSGKQIARKEINGTESMGAHMLPSETGKALAPVYREKIDRIIEDPIIREALR